MPADLDALVNAWIAGMGDKWMGAGNRTSPVNLMLTVTPAEGEDGSGDMRVFDMKLTNLGSLKDPEQAAAFRQEGQELLEKGLAISGKIYQSITEAM